MPVLSALHHIIPQTWSAPLQVHTASPEAHTSTHTQNLQDMCVCVCVCVCVLYVCIVLPTGPAGVFEVAAETDSREAVLRAALK